MPIDITPTLFDGIEAAVNTHFRIRSYKHRLAQPMLDAGSGPSALVGLVRRMRELVSDDLQRALRHPARRISGATWRRAEPQLTLSARNESPEVLLERQLVRSCQTLGRTDWTNQVPVASGLIGSSKGRRRAIDLVRERRATAYEFVELKVGSDTPLYAAIEILEYGLLWLLSRECKQELGRAAGTLLDGDEAHLSVLAPASFYRGLTLDRLAAGFDQGIREVAQDHGGAMSFRFETFPAEFRWPADYEPAQLVRFFDERVPR